MFVDKTIERPSVEGDPNTLFSFKWKYGFAERGQHTSLPRISASQRMHKRRVLFGRSIHRLVGCRRRCCRRPQRTPPAVDRLRLGLQNTSPQSSYRVVSGASLFLCLRPVPDRNVICRRNRVAVQELNFCLLSVSK